MQVVGPIKPVSHITIDTVVFRLSTEYGLYGRANGSLLGISIDVVLNVSSIQAQQAGAPKLAVVATTGPVDFGDLLLKVWPGAPEQVTSLVSSFSFSQLQAYYNTTTNKFGLVAVPSGDFKPPSLSDFSYAMTHDSGESFNLAVEPFQFAVSMGITIPTLGVENASASLQLLDGLAMLLQVIAAILRLAGEHSWRSRTPGCIFDAVAGCHADHRRHHTLQASDNLQAGSESVPSIGVQGLGKRHSCWSTDRCQHCNQ